MEQNHRPLELKLWRLALVAEPGLNYGTPDSVSMPLLCLILRCPRGSHQSHVAWCMSAQICSLRVCSHGFVGFLSQAKWKHPFNRYQTQKQESFSVDERTSLRIPMMHQKEMHRFLYDQDVACTVLQIEYSGNAQALLILPDPGKMEQVEVALQPETLRKWGQLLLPR